MYFDIKQPRRSATLLAAVSQYENSTSCVMLLPICSSVVVVTDSASAPLFSLALLLSHQLKPPTATVYLRAIHPLAGGTTCFLVEAPVRPLLITLSCQKICREPRMRDAAQTSAGQATRRSITVICYLSGLITAKRKSATTFAQGRYRKYQSARS